MDFRQIDKNLQKEFALKRIRAEKIATHNLYVANSTPAFQTLTALEKELSLEVSKLKTAGKDYKGLSSSLSAVREKKSKVLEKLGLSANDLIPKYSCKKCHDSGFYDGAMCTCYQKRRNEELVKAFGIIVPKNHTFKSFNTNVCKDEKQKNELEKLSKILQKWCDSFPNITKTSITITGKPGVGKTYMTECLANALLAKNYSVCFVSAFELNNAFLNYHTAFDSNKQSWLSPFLHSDFLFIDDLGTEPKLKNVTQNYLYLILSERARLNKPVVITSNLSPEDILETYGERIYSRLASKNSSLVCEIPGDDLRLK